MTTEDYTREALKTWTGKLPGTADGIEYLWLGLISEVGEVAGVLKRILRDEWPIEVWRPKLVAELGDVCWYAAVRDHEEGWSPAVNMSGTRDALTRIWEEVNARMGEAGIAWEECRAANIAKLRDRQARGVIKGDGDER